MAHDPRTADAAGCLYVVATPIGNLGDITQRAIDTLSKVDAVAAEDTRHSARLLQHLGLHKPLIALHDHNERARSGALLDRVAGGEQIALVSDAGTPLISDPGFVLVREARERGLRVVPIPGASALITALSAAGLPTDRFVFAGFPPAKNKARQDFLAALANETGTLVFYESPHRVRDTIDAMVACFGETRQVVLARELTKTFEQFYDATLGALQALLEADPNASRGEMVLIVAGAAPVDNSLAQATGLDIDRLLKALLSELPVKSVARIAADATGIPKNQLYERALQLKTS
ncbi:16S rRNA (cytidine(1402)-2'-O)-methyltransferase [Mangrovitalea sediminis]|uniref:16S rRNA (cytidine(1402)-2'-O)-methyltransferase n=1 Tax=Mangrovitalea sediminis TaxID=1982043 RepID=UPI000BE584C5|nr:16S rRNA (cytidine(1402)-2'-O)-methyltransferase [Mangrovitalea sediminis]